mmetsp:Transcript_37229/g.59776  ORF Transcript_37229/g.59776 Transcript_37229/m.59776 type:complete len:209 (-) Transcript_37229:937-1563(-)
MREAVAIHRSRLSPHEKHLARRGYSADRVVGRPQRRTNFAAVHDRLLGGGAAVDVKDPLPPFLPVNVQSARVHRGELRDQRAILPRVHARFGGGDHVVWSHGDVQRLDLDVLAIHRRANGVAQNQDELSGILPTRRQYAILPTRANRHQTLHVLGVALVRLGVPEDDARLGFLRFSEGVHQGVAKVPPLVVRSDVGKVYVAVHCQCHA